jgi:hypothetical protein
MTISPTDAARSAQASALTAGSSRSQSARPPAGNVKETACPNLRFSSSARQSREIIPLQERIETVGDDADLQEVYDTERHLLYVACTRARDHLLVTGVAPVSEFLDDFVRGDQGRAAHE